MLVSVSPFGPVGVVMLVTFVESSQARQKIRRSPTLAAG
jgi:hypothetical protein